MRYAILLGILLIATPLLLRVGSADPWPDNESYGTLASIREPARDVDAFVLQTLFSFLPPQLVLVILAAITLTAASFIRSDELFVGLFAASPAFLFTFTSLTTTPIIITIATVATALLFRGHVWALAAIPLCVAIDASSGILVTLVLVTVLVAQSKTFAAMGASFLAIVSSSIAAWLDPTFGLELVSPLAAWRTSLLSLSGGAALLVGFLALVGFVSVYRQTKRRMLFLLIPLALLVQSLAHGSVVLAGLFAYFAADAAKQLYTRTWSFQELRDITLIILLSSVVFTTAATVRALSTPDEERVAFMRFASSGFPSDARVWVDTTTAPLLHYKRIETVQAPFPTDPSFTASSARALNATYIATTYYESQAAHLPVLYRGDATQPYIVHIVPS
jgi:hypothetical protein